MNKLIHPRLSLVGAGPGDPGLITVKGLKILQIADVVLYDALIHPDLLEEAPATALKIYVGKRAGAHCQSQEQINQLIVDFAFSHGHVVRLKGGDPFVFGRGHEELRFAKSRGVETLVVPGISSCLSLPELQDIPLTRRGLSESFWVITGTTRSGSLSNDIAIAARSTATVVVLMGMRKLREIAATFEHVGKGNTPVLIIQNGSLPNEKSVLGNINTIVQKSLDAEIGTPAIIVIGEVVRLHPQMSFELIQQSYLKNRA